MQVLVVPAKLGDISAELHAIHHLSTLPPLPLHTDIRIARYAAFRGRL